MTAAKAKPTSPRQQAKTSETSGARSGSAQTETPAGARTAKPDAPQTEKPAAKADAAAQAAERTRTAATNPFAQMFTSLGMPGEFASLGLSESFPFNGTGYEHLAEIGSENVRAMVAAGTIFSKGLEALTTEMSGYAQDALAESVEAARRFAEVRDFEQLMDYQSAYAKTAYDRLVAETAKLSEMSVETARESIKPINERVNAATDSFIKTVTG